MCTLPAKSSQRSCANPRSCSITSILVSRFILNLREVDHRGANGGGGSDTLLSSAGTGSSFVVAHPRGAASTMRFASVASAVDVLGAPLAHESHEEAFGEEEDAEGWGADPEKAVGGGGAPAESEGGVVLMREETCPPAPGVQSLWAREPGPVPGRSAEVGSAAV